MSQQTVKDLAMQMRKPVSEIVRLLHAAGISAAHDNFVVSPIDRAKLLQQMSRGSTVGRPTVVTPAPAVPAEVEAEVAPAPAARITMTRKETSEIKLGGGRGPGKTVSVEVVKKRTFTGVDEAKTKQAAEEALARARAEREAEAERLRIEAEAEKARLAVEAAEMAAREAEDAELAAANAIIREAAEKVRLETEAAAAKVVFDHERKLKADPVYKAKWQAEQVRHRASENLRRASENIKRAEEEKKAAALVRPTTTTARKAEPARTAVAAAPGTAAAPSRDGRDKEKGRGGERDRDEKGRGREELHLKDKGGKKGKKGASRNQSSQDNAHAFEKPVAPIVREIEVPEAITVGELASRMAVRATDLIKIMMKNGVFATINQTLDQDTAVLMVEEMGHTATAVKDTAFEDSLVSAVEGDQSAIPIITRAPVVTIMGHVDHGKTSLLDHIRKTRVAAGEAGGITQHIGAYHVSTPRGVITFLDTPGHAAFTRMRARGAKITDVVILVVAGDDGVMPQTREAIQHAKAAGAPMVVAITKVDKSQVNLDRVKNELLQEEVLVEGYGGQVQCVGVSAHSGQGIDELLEAISSEAELLELKAPIEANARGSIIEASIEKGRGAVATVLVRSGTLKQGDVILTGPHFGRVRAMFDELGRPVKSAGPSIPVQVLGLSGAPDAGDDVVVVADERKARELALFRESKMRDQKLAQNQAIRLENAFASMGEGEQKVLNVLVKADVQGSAEAIAESLRKIPSQEVRVNVVSSTIGAISESDIELAVAAKAILIGFNVRADAQAKKRISDTGVDVRYYSIIYNILDDITDAVSGMLGTETREQIVGVAQVREVFRSSKLGDIAGCLIMDGSVQKGLPIRVLRNNTVIYEGELESLRRFKDDVQKVEAGTECGIGVKNYNNVKAGDQIECFTRTEVRRSVKSN